ncbi:MAG: ABC transporter permease [Rhodothermales bacterium]
MEAQATQPSPLAVQPRPPGRDDQAQGEPFIRIEPPKGWRLVNWRELVAYRDLLTQFVLRDVSARYKQTVLGYAWAVIRPVFSMVVFTVIFGNLAAVPSDGAPYALFSYAALLPWTYFSGALGGATNSLTAQKGIFTKVYFPRLIIPLAPVITGLVDFAIASVVLAGLMVYYGVAPTLNVVFLPLLILIMVATAFGAGLWLSSLSVQYRDVNQAMTFAMQLLMYAAPVVWPVSLIVEKFPVWGETLRLVYGLYPMAGVIEGFRASLLGTVPMPWDLIAIGAGVAAFLVITGSLLFRRMERTFADVA